MKNWYSRHLHWSGFQPNGKLIVLRYGKYFFRIYHHFKNKGIMIFNFFLKVCLSVVFVFSHIKWKMMIQVKQCAFLSLHSSMFKTRLESLPNIVVYCQDLPCNQLEPAEPQSFKLNFWSLFLAHLTVLVFRLILRRNLFPVNLLYV